ncbi:ArsR/SmtB family transcription factor [Saccharibacillus endophyticus]|uniref:Transcriptional regulator n=1 Tax=Saccharibacillus endophyticus TaxID=2060666 RepID=A0ABQ1ZNI7_9BACL|nr:metalloregulator ArsR/SmtB family transcription factor [Saccharibacillus endophyticus]GGH70210.1 transcriptional regulator [Saccharibacillus endophyticus]
MSLVTDQSSCTSPNFVTYAEKFKAMSDPKRLELLHLLCINGSTCVCDLVDEMNIPQSKLSYHLKILLNADLIFKETKGTWSYYSLNEDVMSRILSRELCCILTPSL